MSPKSLFPLSSLFSEKGTDYSLCLLHFNSLGAAQARQFLVAWLNFHFGSEHYKSEIFHVIVFRCGILFNLNFFQTTSN